MLVSSLVQDFENCRTFRTHLAETECKGQDLIMFPFRSFYFLFTPLINFHLPALLTRPSCWDVLRSLKMWVTLSLVSFQLICSQWCKHSWHVFQFVLKVPTSVKSGLSLVIHGHHLPLPLDALTSIMAFFLYWRWSPYVSRLLNYFRTFLRKWYYYNNILL